MQDDTENRDRQPGHPHTESYGATGASASTRPSESERRPADDVRDPFSEYLRQRLENHRLPIDDIGWEEMEARMQAQRSASRRSSSLRRTVVWIAAAVVVAFILLVPFLQEERRSLTADKVALPPEQPALSPERSLPSDTMSMPSAPLSTLPPTDRIQENAILSEARRPLSVDKDTLSSLSTEPVAEPLDSISGAVADASIPSSEEALADATQGASEPSSPAPLPSLDARTKAVRRSLGDQTEPARKSGSPLSSPVNVSGGWLLAARVGTEGYASLPDGWSYDLAGPKDPSSDCVPGGPSDFPVVNPEPVPPSLPQDISPEDFADADYLPPLSFGLTVRKRLTSRVGIETGLVYTYLASRFSQAGVPRLEAKQELHYLGIPLNAVVYLYNRSRWDFYFMGGGMVEKGVQSVYSVTGYQSYDILTRTERKAVNGLQWSLNVSLGLSYRFYGPWSFYLEPRFSYYFDTNQPASIRTDKPLGFGLGGGIRYAF